MLGRDSVNYIMHKLIMFDFWFEIFHTRRIHSHRIDYYVLCTTCNREQASVFCPFQQILKCYRRCYCWGQFCP